MYTWDVRVLRVDVLISYYFCTTRIIVYLAVFTFRQIIRMYDEFFQNIHSKHSFFSSFNYHAYDVLTNRYYYQRRGLQKTDSNFTEFKSA